jgi:Antirestriction protein (ArdA)
MNSVATARQTGTAVFFAQPYSLDAKGFYFDTYEDYARQAVKCRDRFGHHVEEFEIQFIDGPDGDLYRAAGLDQSTLHWLDDLESLDDWQKPALFFLLDNGMVSDVGEAIAKADEVCLSSSSLRDAATDLFDDCYAHQIPEALRVYIDYEAFARDLRLGGDFVEFDYQGETFTCTNASGL